MTAKANEIQFSVNLETDVLDRLTSMAAHGDLSRHKLMVNLLTTGIEQIELLRHIGIFQLALVIRNMTESPEQANIRRVGEVKPSEMPIPLRIDNTLMERLKKLAEKGDLNRQRLAQNIIKTGLEELEKARKLGLTDIVIKLRDTHDLLKDFLKIGEQAYHAGKEVQP